MDLSLACPQLQKPSMKLCCQSSSGWWYQQDYVPSLSIFIVQLTNGACLLLSHWQNKHSEVVWVYKELDKVTNSNLFLCSSQPAPGPREISPEADPTVPNLGTGPDRVSGEAAVRVLRCGVIAQEAGRSHLCPWGYPAVPTEGVVPVRKLWLLCLRVRGALPCWRRSHSFSARCIRNPSAVASFRETEDRGAAATPWALLWHSSLLKEQLIQIFCCSWLWLLCSYSFLHHLFFL